MTFRKNPLCGVNLSGLAPAPLIADFDLPHRWSHLLDSDSCDHLSPVGIMPAFSIMRITVRCGARVRCSTP